MAGTHAKLSKYRAKRDFHRTAEPSGAEPITPGHRFVIQQHAARRMHYDFRLELDGVLLSWSVPKGPSLSPSDRRLAVRTEDHPLDYANFEGVIPPGEYGGGTVSVWDRGTWEPQGDARAGLAAGKLTFELHGAKLHGRWHLVRTKPQGKQESWLLFKGRDDAADDEADVIAEHPESVLSGRTIEQIARAPDRVWHEGGDDNATRPDLDTVLASLQLGFELTNLDKVMYPEQGITKGQLIAYFAVVAERMLPHVARRPLMTLRCPEGRKKCFFQKHVLAGSPRSIGSVKIVESGGELVEYMQVADLAGMIGLAQLGTLEVHTWGARADKPERPDLIVFDLDPDEGLAWDRVALAALELRGLLREVELESFVKTTGGKGLHVVVPIERRTSWPELKDFSKAVADELARREPSAYTTKLAKAHRRDRIFIDYLRNGRGATFIAPYSPRARHGAPIATPITWEELAGGEIESDEFTLHNITTRLEEPDPWADMPNVKQAITAAARRALG